MYEIAQVIELATGRLPTAAQLDSWGAYENAGGSLQTISDAFVASTMFAEKYNNGVAVDPNAPISFDLAQEIMENALGTTPSTAHVDAWLDTGLSVGQIFQDFAMGDQLTVKVESQLFIYQENGSYFTVPFNPAGVEILGITLAGS